MKKWLVADKVGTDEYKTYSRPRVVEASSPEEAVYKYNELSNTKSGWFICRMYDDQKEGPISEKEIYEYLSDVVKKLHAFVEHYTKTL